MKWLIILALIPCSAYAGETTCKEIRAGIAVVGGAENAEKIARSMGVSEERIEQAKRCLKKRPGQQSVKG